MVSRRRRLTGAWIVISITLVGFLFQLASWSISESLRATYFPDTAPFSGIGLVEILATFVLAGAGFALGVWLLKTAPSAVSGRQAGNGYD